MKYCTCNGRNPACRLCNGSGLVPSQGAPTWFGARPVNPPRRLARGRATRKQSRIGSTPDTPCPICGKKLRGQQGVREHMKMMHDQACPEPPPEPVQSVLDLDDGGPTLFVDRSEDSKEVTGEPEASSQSSAAWDPPVPDDNATLFTEKRPEALRSLAVTEEDLASWVRRGWLRADVLEMAEIDYPVYLEVRFIRSLVVSPLSHEQISQLLESLPRPFSFPADRIAYHFERGWVMLPLAERSEEPHDILAAWLDQLVSDGAMAELETILESVEAAIDAAREADGSVE